MRRRKPISHKSKGFRRSESTEQESVYFYSDAFGFRNAEFREAQEGEINPSAVVKKALVMVEGTHIDSNKRKHVFSAERVQRVVENTNRMLASGGRVPWQKDHQKTQDANIGDLEGKLEVRIITERDLPNPRSRHLIGKVGAFASELVAKGADVVQEVVAGRIKTLSPGIDLVTDTIREISATPTPAIVGLSTFRRASSQSYADFALSMEEAMSEQEDEDALKEEFEELGDKFWVVVSSISNAQPEELGDQEPSELLMNAIADYSYLVQELLGLTEDQDPNQSGYPGQQQQQQPMAPMQGGMARMNRSEKLALFTMGGLEAAEFGRRRGSKDKAPRKKRGMLATAGMAAGGAAALGAAGYGINAGMRSRKFNKGSQAMQQKYGGTAAKTNALEVMKGDANRAGASIAGAAGAAKAKAVGASNAVGRSFKRAGRLGGAGWKGGKGAGKAVGAAKGLLRTGVGKAGAAGLGLAAAGGAGYGAYKMLSGRKKRK